jgi:methylenetetrahydrofolate reductase (NADPH)
VSKVESKRQTCARIGRTLLPPEQRTVLAALVANSRYELIPLKPVHEQATALLSGACVTVTALPRLGMEPTLGLSEWLTDRGYDVVPHFSARLIRDRVHLADLLARVRRAGLRKVFVVGGDGPAMGDFNNGLALLRAFDDLGHSFDEVSVPAYPEGHPNIPGHVLLQTLREKQAYVHAMTTQMSFNPNAVAAWIVRIRDEGITLPIHLGVPGVVELPKLIRRAARIGVADSARYLRRHQKLLGHVTRRGSFGADAFLEALAPTLANPAADVRVLHVFTLNEVTATLDWQRRMLEELA